MQEHEKRYKFLLEKDTTGATDLERKALFYILAGSDDLYNKVNHIYDFNDHSINPDCFDEIDLCSSSRKLIEIAFNHFNGYPADISEVLSVLDNDNFELAIDSMRLRYNQ